MFYRSRFKVKLKGYFQKAVAAVVTVTVFFLSVSPVTYAFAKTINVDQQLDNKIFSAPGCTIISNDDGSIYVKYKNEESTIKVYETDDIRTVVVIDKKSGSHNKLVLNKKSKTVFSSYTGKTIQLSNLYLQDQQELKKIPKHSRVKRYAVNGVFVDGAGGSGYGGGEVRREIERISWREIRNLTGSGYVSATGLVASVTAMFNVAKVFSSVVGIVAGILGTTSYFFIPDDDYHGLAFELSYKLTYVPDDFVPVETELCYISNVWRY